MEKDIKDIKWYHKPASIVVAILVAGPLALPLVWISPALKRWHKAVITCVIIAITAWLVKASADLYSTILKELKDLQALAQ